MTIVHEYILSAEWLKETCAIMQITQFCLPKQCGTIREKISALLIRPCQSLSRPEDRGSIPGIVCRVVPRCKTCCNPQLTFLEHGCRSIGSAVELTFRALDSYKSLGYRVTAFNIGWIAQWPDNAEVVSERTTGGVSPALR